MLKNKFLNKINEDIFHQVEKVRILALSTVSQLNSDSFSDHDDDYSILLNTLKRATKSHSQDIRFLARKAVNHLEGFTPGSVQSPAASMEDRLQIHEHEAAGPETADDSTVNDLSSLPGESPEPSMREKILAALEAIDDPNKISIALSKLIECGEPGDIRAVAGFIKHKDGRVRSHAVEFMAAFAPRDIQLKIIVPLMEDPDNRVKGNVAKALAELGEKSVTGYVAQLLSDEKLSNRESAVYALSCFPDTESAKHLLFKALSDPYDGVRFRAIRALTEIGDHDAIPHLTKLLSEDNPHICEAAGNAIRTIDPHSHSEEPLTEPETVESADEHMVTGSAQAEEDFFDSQLEEAAAEDDSYFTDAVSTNSQFFEEETEDSPADTERENADDLQEEIEANSPVATEEDSADGDVDLPHMPHLSPPGSEKQSGPPQSKADILANLDAAADALLGSSNEYVASVQRKMKGLSKDGLKNLLEHELCTIADKVFAAIRSGSLNSNDLNQPYYDILKYQDFKVKQEQRLTQKTEESNPGGGFFANIGKKLGLIKKEESSAKEALERLDKKVQASKVELATKAVKLLKVEPERIAGGEDYVRAIELVRNAISEA